MTQKSESERLTADAIFRLRSALTIRNGRPATNLSRVRHEDLLAILDDLDARRRSPSPEAVEWRPIESAPKDGTAVLTIHVGVDRHYEIAWFERRGWYGQASGYWQDKDAPTHWQPLPSPPAPGE